MPRCGTNSTNPIFPVEVNEYIIDHLHDDPAALYASSLVNKDWTRTAQHHLFACLSLDSESAPRAMLLPVLTNTVRHMVINDLGNSHVVGPPMQPVPSNSQTTYDLTISLWRRVAGVFKYVTHIELDRVRYFKPAELMPIITSFPHLDTLTIRQPEWCQTAFSPKEFEGVFSNLDLRLVDVNDRNAVAVKEWALAHSKSISLKVLHFHVHKFQSYPIVQKIINEFKDSLTDIRFDLTFAQNLNESNRAIFWDITKCKQLRRLHIDNIVLVPGFPMLKSIPWITVLLSQVQSISTLEEIVFTVLLHRDADIGLMNWPAINPSIALLSNLKRVVVIVQLDSVEQDSSRIIQDLRRQHLPSFHVQNRLAVEILSA